jgi:S-formylglutathione hydrolase FrmB
MSFFTGTIYSSALNMDTSVGVILPQDSRKHRGVDALHEGITSCKTPKTLILLHGLSDNYSVWLNRTSLLRYAEDYDIAVLMPEVQRSFYQDMKYGPAYFTYITDELPRLAAELFAVSISPADLMIAGLSMGGYGALYATLTYPERFYGAACFSSAFDLRSFVEDDAFAARKELRGWDNDRKGIFGEPPVCPPAKDLFDLAVKTAKNPKTPRLFMTCGTEDFLYSSNIAMRDLLAANAYDLRYEEWPGIHEWGFWDLSIQKMLNHFLL